MVLDSSTTSNLSRIVFIISLLHFLMKSFVAVDGFLLFSLDAFPPISSANYKTAIVILSFKLSKFPFISFTSFDIYFEF